MNNCILIGRLTKDPEVRYTATEMAVAKFNLAIDRPGKNSGEKQTDFPQITVFGKQAENCEKYLFKGQKVAIEGRIQTGSYEDKNGNTVYTTGVVASRVEFIEFRKKEEQTVQAEQGEIPDSFQQIDEDVPF